VIFTSLKTLPDDLEYNQMAQQMSELAAAQPGYLGMEHVGDETGAAITVSYWESLESIRNWRQNADHLQAQSLGKSKWYDRFYLRVCRVERAYEFEAPGR
jgi:heme-degrading monooxygenase HmoA